MKLRRRDGEQPPPVPRPDYTRIAVLEYDLFGIPPQPGSAAAVVIALRRASTCIEHQPIDISAFGDLPGTHILCAGCGNHLMPTKDGGWQVANIRKERQP